MNGRYLLGDLQEAELLEKLSDNSILRSRELCKLYFAKALKSFSENDLQSYKMHLNECVSEYGFLEPEYYIANGELYNLQEEQNLL